MNDQRYSNAKSFNDGAPTAGAIGVRGAWAYMRPSLSWPGGLSDPACAKFNNERVDDVIGKDARSTFDGG